jgi:hypothetical protein
MSIGHTIDACIGIVFSSYTLKCNSGKCLYYNIKINNDIQKLRNNIHAIIDTIANNIIITNINTACARINQVNTVARKKTTRNSRRKERKRKKRDENEKMKTDARKRFKNRKKKNEEKVFYIQKKNLFNMSL